MMIEAVMKGPTPNMTMDRLERPPPEKMFRKPKNWLEFRRALKLAAFTLGMGMADNTRKSTSASTVKPMRFLNMGS